MPPPVQGRRIALDPGATPAQPIAEGPSSVWPLRPTPGGPSSSLATKGFGTKGVNRFYSPSNTNGNQFNKPAAKQALVGAVRAHTRSQYFRHAGFGAALRHTLGIEQVPSHQTDYINAQRRLEGKRQNGINPDSLISPMNPKTPWEPWGEVQPEA